MQGYHASLRGLNILDSGTEYVIRPMSQNDAVDHAVQLRGIGGIIVTGYMQSDGEIAMPGQTDVILPLMPLLFACGWSMTHTEGDLEQGRMRNPRIADSISVYTTDQATPSVSDEDSDLLRRHLREQRGYRRDQDRGLERRDPEPTSADRSDVDAGQHPVHQTHDTNDGALIAADDDGESGSAERHDRELNLSTHDNPADLFTELIDVDAAIRLRASLGVGSS